MNKCKICKNDAYKPPKGGMCPNIVMGIALKERTCISCARKIDIKEEIKTRKLTLQENIKAMDLMCTTTNPILIKKFTKMNKQQAHKIIDLEFELKTLIGKK